MYKELESKLKSKLGDFYFTIDDAEQSFVVYPTNHLYLVNDFYCVNVGHVIYNNITEYDQVIDNIQTIVGHCSDAQDQTGDYVQVVYLQDSDQPWRVVFGGFDNDQHDFDFEELDQLLNKLKTFEF
jgi:hypothetical protein|tara:strand:+ start:832 stop:1209 length:378 start_codon:yes stop_codon:yes gene_type:complete